MRNNEIGGKTMARKTKKKIKRNREELENRILKILKEELTTAELVDLHNGFCEVNRYYDDWIEQTWDINTLYSGKSPLEIIETFNGLNTSKRYYILDMYGATSFDYYDDSPVTYYEEIAMRCAHYDDGLGNSKIRECIEEWEAENEEEEEDE